MGKAHEWRLRKEGAEDDGAYRLDLPYISVGDMA